MAYSAQTSKKAVHLMHDKLLQSGTIVYATFLADTDFVAYIPIEAERIELVKARRLKEWDFLGSAEAPVEVRLRGQRVTFDGSTKS